MSDHKHIHRLLERAQTRAGAQLLLEQLSWGVCAGLAAGLLLLLLGTQMFDWYWPLLLVVLTLAAGWWRGRRRRPGESVLARRLDAALGLRDLLATAVHFDGPSGRRADAAFLDVVESRAESAAAAADATVALRLRAPRSLWAVGVLALLSIGLFALRYGVLRTFDPRAPIVEVRFDTLSGAPQPQKKAPGELARRGPLPEPFSLNLPEDERSNVNEKDDAVRESLRTVDGKDPSQIARDGQKGEQGHSAQEGDAEESEEGDNPGATKNAPAGTKDGQRAGTENSQDKPGRQEKDSLMDKMRDALANLMDKLKIEPKGEGKQSASTKSGQKGAGQKDKGSPQPGRPNQPGEPDANQQGQQPGDGENAMQARANQQGGKDDPSQNEKSGIGKQDGKKDIELAEQQKAMGKLSELLGKRSLNLQGEVMVEVTNSKNQQLKTPFVSRTATHAEAGGEVSRDEVPLDRREFVERYYEQMRRQTQPAKP